MNLEQKINKNKLSLGPLDIEILDYIVANKHLVIENNLNVLASKINVSPSMINKTLRKVEIDGHKELKIILVKETYIQELYQVNEITDFQIEQNVYLKSIIDTTAKLDYKILNMVIDDFLETEQNLIWGEGFMKYVAKDFQRKFNKLQISFRTLEDLENLKYINIEKSTHVLILSTSGETPSIGKVVNWLRDEVKNLKITAITSSEVFAWKDKIDYHLHGSCEYFIDTHEKEIPTSSRMVIQYMLDIIFRNFFFRNREKNISIIGKLAKIY